jgi:hypothetical protein
MNATYHAVQAEKYAQQAMDADLLAHLAEERGDNVAARAHLETYQSLIELSRYHRNATIPIIHNAAPCAAAQ